MDRKIALILIMAALLVTTIFLKNTLASEDIDGCVSCGGGRPDPPEPPETTTTTSTTTTSTTTTTTAPFCGDGIINNGDQCELPNTNNSVYCPQTTSQCLGTKYGTRDNNGNCGPACLCVQDPFNYQCVKGQCGATCVVNADCPNKCVDNIRYYSGSCSQSSCSCSYQTQNCDSLDGYYSTTQTRWAPCADDACKQCEQKKKDHRDYMCEALGCKYVVDGEEWIDTGKRKVIVCPFGTYCSDGECVNKECKGYIGITVDDLQFCPNAYHTFTASGLFICDNKIVTFKEGSCDGDILGKCKLKNNKCAVSIKFSDLGTPTVFACIDKNSDGDFSDTGEQDSVTVNVNCNNCFITKCPNVCHMCWKCSGPCKTFVNQYKSNICLNPDKSCDYSCTVGFCGARLCNGDPSRCG